MSNEQRERPTKGQHGGVREGAGRKPQYDDGPFTVTTANLSAEQRERFKVLGGAQWLRETLDRDQHPALRSQTRPESELISFRLTVAQREKLRKLGGAAWLRDVLNRSIAAAESNSREE
ncbi:MAG: hypothetical protein RIS35_2455 [Pseudomonadota bacterium]|jgi:hypothetical protein